QLAGLEKPTKGTVTINGENVSKMNEKQLAVFRQNNIGFIFQSYNLLPTLTAVENVAFPLIFKGVDKKVREKKARAILKEMQMGERMNHKPTELSGGQQQRVGIARAFVGKPSVIFADEPTGNLDSKTTEQVMDMLIDISEKNNITFVMVTHDPELAKKAKRVITIVDGNIIHDTKNDSEGDKNEKQ
ncbi:MAG: ABC transporter ATP-binding protein, partial [Oscillospiraceae bacterium]|nr:ABC transporter ATP-binding protein [Oscillospiraceae bacterium]